MGCNTSQGATVVDPSEKPQERPKMAAPPEEATAVETVDSEDKDVGQEKNDSSS